MKNFPPSKAATNPEMFLKAEHLSLSFNTYNRDNEPEHTQVLHDVSFTIKSGETTALVGESGSGKSVTAFSILRLLEESSSVTSTGSIYFENRDLYTLTLDEMRLIRGNKIAMIFQEPMTSLNPVYTIGSQMMEPLILHQKMAKKEAEKEAIQLLGRTGIDDPENRFHVFPHQLSGGQRQRVVIAMALACKPSLLIADEPTTALDVTIQAQILELIKDIQTEYRMGVLLITHDLVLVRNNASHIYIMEKGRIIEHGKTEQLFSSPSDNYTKRLLSATWQQPRQETRKGPLLLKTDNLNCHFQMSSSFDRLFKKKTRVIKAVDRVNLKLLEGTTCGVVGESGSGKTTLAMAILKLVKSRGKIIFDGQNLEKMNNRLMRPLRKNIQIVFQDPFSSLSPRLTVEEIISEGIRVHLAGITQKQRKNIVTTALHEVGLTEDMAIRYPHEFSGGQRQRIAIARAIVLKPRLLILDEPTSALDVTIQAQIINLLHSLQKKYNMTYLFISHDLRVVQSLADYIVVMQHGQIVESGTAEEIFSSPSQKYTQTLFKAALQDFQIPQK